jgi:hypothetical protein
VENQHALIAGEDMLGVNHYFSKHWDMRGYASGLVTFMCRRTPNWEMDDEVYVEVFYGGTWYGLTTLTTANTSDATFELVELPLTEAMMKIEFGLRFRNGMDAGGEHLDIDDVYLYGNPVIPTLSEWGMIVLAGLLLGLGLLVIARRRRASCPINVCTAPGRRRSSRPSNIYAAPHRD